MKRFVFLVFLFPAVAWPAPERQIEDTFEEMDRAGAQRALDRYAGDSAEQKRGMPWIFQEERFAKKPGKNYALRLLVHLLEKRPVRPGDTMPIALALAYNYNFSAGNEGVRAALLGDIIAHYDLYKTILEWQNKHARFALLDRLPLTAQTYWASRDRSVIEIRTTKDYALRLPAIGQLSRLHTLLAENPLIGGRDAYSLAQSIDNFYRSKLLRPADLTDSVKGYAAGPLLDYFEKHGQFPSESCVSDATNLAALFQAAGLAPLAYYQNFRSAGAKEGTNHEWLAIYDLDSRRFISTQRGKPWPSYNTDRTPVDFEIFRPMWHHAWMEQAFEEQDTMTDEERAPPAHIGGRLRRNAYGERTTNGAMRAFVLQGLTDAQIEELWTIPVWRKNPDGRLTLHVVP